MEAAIIGVAFRFPGANDLETYWANIEQRKSSIIEIPRERWDWRSIWGDPKLETNKSNSKWGGFIDHVDAFDHEFFGLLPKVVQNMDPAADYVGVGLVVPRKRRDRSLGFTWA
jgi:polyketide synthase PksN